MNEIIKKIAQLTEKRDVEISINIRLGQDVVKTTSDALSLLTNELNNAFETIKKASKKHIENEVNHLFKEKKDS